MSSIKVNASILCADFTKLGEEIRCCEEAGVDMFHIDVMDGHFVPNLTIGPLMVEAVKSLTKLPVDVHLMIENPTAYLNDYLNAGADIISVHAECFGLRREGCREWNQYPKEIDAVDIEGVKSAVFCIKERGKQAYVVLNPGTPMCLGPVLEELDGVLIMSVNPGFARQKFMPSVLSKIEELKAAGFQGDIAIDGGVNADTAPGAVKAGANILITASYFFGADDRAAAVSTLKS